MAIIVLLTAVNLKAQTFKQIWPADSTFKKFNPSQPIFSLPTFLGSPVPNLRTTGVHLFNLNNNIKIVDNMPIAELNGFDDMPVANLGGNYPMYIKRVIIEKLSMVNHEPK